MNFERALAQTVERLKRSGVFEMGDGFDELIIKVEGPPTEVFVLSDAGMELKDRLPSKDALAIHGSREALTRFLSGSSMPQQMFLRKEVVLSGNLEFAQRLWRVFDIHPEDGKSNQGAT